MNELLKGIRTYLNLSQQEFADSIGVSLTTVNRWEIGRAQPNRLIQEKLFSLSCDNSVPVMNLIRERIKLLVENIELDSGRIILYHGSKSGIVGDIEPKSRIKCDFGRGFYMGTDPTQPLTLVCDFDKSKFYIVSVTLDNLDLLEVSQDIEWAMLVAYHRGKLDRIKGTSIYQKHQLMSESCDMMIGSIANDRIFYVIDNFFMGNITDIALVKSLSALQLGQQYVAVTKKGCNAIRIEKEIYLSHLERRFLQRVSEENRVRGISLANDICRNYRREGLFFDEILDAAE